MKRLIQRLYSITLHPLIVKIKQFLHRKVLPFWQSKIVLPWDRFEAKRIRPIFRAIAKYSGLTWVSKQYAKIPHKFKDWLYGYLFILPWILGMGLIGLPVLGRSIRMALSDKYFFVAGQGF